MFIGSVPLNHRQASTLLTMGPITHSAYCLGTRDLVGEVEREIVDSVDRTMPVLIPAFIMSTIHFASEVPTHTKLAICQDIIDYSHVFSWIAFDLGCITDVPYRVNRFDYSPAVQLSRQHLYTPYNEAILHAKCDPFIQLGIFYLAPPECKDQTQVTIVRTAKTPTDRNNPSYCRIAHDFRLLNDRIQLDSEPVDSVVDMLA